MLASMTVCTSRFVYSSRCAWFKPSKVALIAVARKLLVIANAAIQDGRAWDPKMAAAA